MKGFGITKETQGSSSVAIPAPIELTTPNAQFKTGYEFPVAKLVKVAFVPNKEMTVNGVKEERPVLEMLFKDAKNRQITHIEFPLEEGVDKFDEKLQWQQQRIMHIWEETLGLKALPADGIGTSATSFAEFFEDVAKQFNAVKHKEGDVEKVTYATVPLYIKLTYNKDRVQLPMFPNFVQKAVGADGKTVPVEKLVINPTYDKIKATANVNTTANQYKGGTDNTFGGDDTDGFPEV